VTELLERFGLGERTKDNLEKLSLGNQQRVQIIASVLPRPAALVLDEPFSGLDPRAVDSMVDLLREYTRDGVPVLFSSHQLDLVERLCDRLVVLSQGRRVAAGTVAELRDAGVPRFRLVLGGDAGWVRDLHGLEVLDLEGASALVEVRQDGAEQHLVAEATRRGDVHEFVRVRPALSEIYREATA
jgi:ABC-2 type transport system ATP-binding protein